nr:YjcZ family sporulation protein [Bacillus licheniformis]
MQEVSLAALRPLVVLFILLIIIGASWIC